jgi:hypothetical protein
MRYQIEDEAFASESAITDAANSRPSSYFLNSPVL